MFISQKSCYESHAPTDITTIFIHTLLVNNYVHQPAARRTTAVNTVNKTTDSILVVGGDVMMGQRCVDY